MSDNFFYILNYNFSSILFKNVKYIVVFRSLSSNKLLFFIIIQSFAPIKKKSVQRIFLRFCDKNYLNYRLHKYTCLKKIKISFKKKNAQNNSQYRTKWLKQACSWEYCKDIRNITIYWIVRIAKTEAACNHPPSLSSPMKFI